MLLSGSQTLNMLSKALKICKNEETTVFCAEKPIVLCASKLTLHYVISPHKRKENIHTVQFKASLFCV